MCAGAFVPWENMRDFTMGFGVPYVQTNPDMVYFVKTDMTYPLVMTNIAMG